jgi:hypothetical protein
MTTETAELEALVGRYLIYIRVEQYLAANTSQAYE